MVNDRKEIQALHAAISRRDWHAVEVAGNVLRDQEARPTAPVEGLETVGFVHPTFVKELERGYDEIFRTVRIPENWEPVVTRSQAEAIIAAERNRANDFQAELWGCEIDLNAAKDENAALTARIKELSALIDGENCADPDKIDALFRRAETAETQLAAAGKITQEILSLIAGDAGIPDRIRAKARAVLGGKPSC